jgi:hypothetical protein
MALANGDEVISDLFGTAGGRAKERSDLEEDIIFEGLSANSDSAVIESAIRWLDEARGFHIKLLGLPPYVLPDGVR